MRERKLHLGSSTISVSEKILNNKPSLAKHMNKPLVVGIRPEHLSHAKSFVCEVDNTLPAIVSAVEEPGAEHLVYLQIDVKHIESGDPDSVAETDDETLVIARLDPLSTVVPGDTIHIQIDTDKLHFFTLVMHKI